MWMIDPKILCRDHLCGEHYEIHKHRHNFVKHHSITGRIAGNACEPMAMKKRHDELVIEMLRRGYNHKSSYEQPDLDYLTEYERTYKVDIKESLLLLLDRCTKCKKRYEELSNDR
jgi:hypothetical protein